MQAEGPCAGAGGIVCLEAVGIWCVWARVQRGEGSTTRPEGSVGAVAGCQVLQITICKTSLVFPFFYRGPSPCWACAGHGGPEMNGGARGRESEILLYPSSSGAFRESQERTWPNLEW